jgi:hypothetical protein
MISFAILLRENQARAKFISKMKVPSDDFRHGFPYRSTQRKPGRNGRAGPVEYNPTAWWPGGREQHHTVNVDNAVARRGFLALDRAASAKRMKRSRTDVICSSARPDIRFTARCSDRSQPHEHRLPRPWSLTMGGGVDAVIGTKMPTR